MIICKECGHECTKTDFEGLSGLCDHLFLDALALFQKSMPHTLEIHGGVSGEKECPRCQGLMKAEEFIDWTSNHAFRGWRCLICGNVWDQEIADNRIHGGTDMENLKPGRHRFTVAINLRSKNIGQLSQVRR